MAQTPVLVDEIVQPWATARRAGAKQALGHVAPDPLRDLVEVVEHAARVQRARLERAGLAGGDDEEDDRLVGLLGAQLRIQAGHRFEREVEALVARLEAPRVEEIERALEVEVVAREEVAHYEAVDLLLVLRVVR